ncbi:MAG: hypothetical protein ACI8XB_002604 [Patiriisocius sp.]|jgi:hypothetical protein
MNVKRTLVKNTSVIWMACITLGLAPFNPPHIYQKILQISDNVFSLDAMDWLDVAMHGSPWVLLAIAYILKVKK